MATLTQEHLPQVVAMMAVAPAQPHWWDRRSNREMPRGKRDLVLVAAVKDVAKARGIKPADIRPRLIELGDRGRPITKVEVQDSTDGAIVMDIINRMDEAANAHANEIDRASAAAWAATWAVGMVSAAIDAIAAQAPKP